MQKICKNCGSENEEASSFCKDCGAKLDDVPSVNETNSVNVTKKNRDKKIIIALLAVIVILVIGVLVYSGGIFKQEVPLETTDFGGISMLAPVGSNFVETNSLPSFGDIGGFLILENCGNYSREAFSLMFSTTQGKSHPPEVILDKTVGDIVIYKDSQGRDALYMTRDVGEYEITLIGNDEDAMIKMLDSVKIDDDFSSQSSTTQTSSSSSKSTDSKSWVSIGSYSGSGSGSESVTVPEGKIKVKLSAYPIKNYATNHLYVTSSSGDSGGVDWGSKSAVETRSDSFTFTSKGSETLDIDYYETVSWEVEIYKYQ